MLGLLKINWDQFDTKEDLKTYQAYYCGLCQTLARNFGVFSRLFTNYEATLMYLLFAGESTNAILSEKGFCPVTLSKKNIYSFNSDIIADISIFLAFEKMRDDEYDESKKTPHLIRSRMEKKYRQACDRLKKKRCDVLYLQNLMVLQRKIEGRKIPCFHKTSEPTALMLGYIFGFLSSLTIKGTASKKKYQEIGYQLGKWIYIIDSIVDVEQDSMLQNFNPILLKCNNPVYSKKFRPSDISRPIKNQLKTILSTILTKIQSLLNQIRNHNSYRLVEFILGKDLKRKTETIFNAMDNTPQGSHDLRLVQISSAGLIVMPKFAMASNGVEQACGTCISSILICGIVFYAFKVMFRCNMGTPGCCCPCSTCRPNTVQVQDGCGGRKTLRRGFDGRYRDPNACC